MVEVNSVLFRSVSIIVICLSLIIMILVYTKIIIPFNNEKAYIKSEIARSFGRERKYWKRRLKKLYVSAIPLLGKLLLKFMR